MMRCNKEFDTGKIRELGPLDKELVSLLDRKDYGNALGFCEKMMAEKKSEYAYYASLVCRYADYSEKAQKRYYNQI